MPMQPTPSRRLFAALVDDDFGISRYDGAGTTTLGLFQALQRHSSFEEFHFFVDDVRKASDAARATMYRHRLERRRNEVRQALDSMRPIHDHLPPLGRAIVDASEELTQG